MTDSRTPTFIQLFTVAVKIPLLLVCPLVLPPRDVVLGLAAANGALFRRGAAARAGAAASAAGADPDRGGASRPGAGARRGAGRRAAGLRGRALIRGTARGPALRPGRGSTGGRLAGHRPGFVLGMRLLRVREMDPLVSAYRTARRPAVAIGGGVSADVGSPAGEWAVLRERGAGTWGRTGGVSEVASAPAGSPAAGRARRTAPAPRPSPAARPKPPAAPVPAGPVNASEPPPPAGPAAPPASSSPSVTAAGTLLAGRYRLHTRVGSDTAAGAEFWRAEDTVLQRDVGVTVLRKLGPGGRRDRRRGGPDRYHPSRRDGGPRAALGQLRARRVRPAARRAGPRGSRVPDDVLGAAVTEWVPGRSLAEADGRRNDPSVGRRPCGGPAGRGGRGRAPARPGAGLRPPATDPRSPRTAARRWPSCCPARRHAGRRRARPGRDPVHDADVALAAVARRRGPGRPGHGRARPARRLRRPVALRPGVPVELDALVQGALGPPASSGHVHTAAAVHMLLNEVVAEDDRIALFPPVPDGLPVQPGRRLAGRRPRRPPARPGAPAQAAVGLGGLGDGRAARARLRRRPGRLGVLRGAARRRSWSPAPPRAARQTAGPAADPATVGAAAGRGRPGAVAGVEVYDPSGDRDNDGRVSRVIDGNPSQRLAHLHYKPAVPGAQARRRDHGVVRVRGAASRLTIDSASPGTVDAGAVGAGGRRRLPGHHRWPRAPSARAATQISLAGSQPVTHVLLWITKLGGGGGGEHDADQRGAVPAGGRLTDAGGLRQPGLPRATTPDHAARHAQAPGRAPIPGAGFPKRPRRADPAS